MGHNTRKILAHFKMVCSQTSAFKSKFYTQYYQKMCTYKISFCSLIPAVQKMLIFFLNPPIINPRTTLYFNTMYYRHIFYKTYIVFKRFKCILMNVFLITFHSTQDNTKEGVPLNNLRLSGNNYHHDTCGVSITYEPTWFVFIKYFLCVLFCLK